MELKQRKICGNCRVYSRSSKQCGIGYNTQYAKNGFDIVIDCIPQEPCPKPLTVSDSITAMQIYKKN